MAEEDSDQSDDEFVNVYYMSPEDVKPKVVHGLITSDLSNYDIIEQFPKFPNNLQVIRMSTNELQEIADEDSKIPNSFCQMKCLKELFLYGDAVRNGVGLSSLPRDFGKLKALEVLNLEHNCFSTFPEQICDLSNLKKLYLNGCGLTYISSKIRNLYNLLETDLSDNDFSSGLCKELFDLPKLKDLYLMNCNLSKLPEEVGNLVVLEGLRLNGNSLTEFPENLYTMKHLKKLAAPKNKISKLSENIIGLESLKVLSLGENNLTSLPKAISKLQYLQVLNVFGNRLTRLPNSFVDLGPSSKIIIEGNHYLLQPPLSICSKGIDSIKGFFESMAKSDKIHSNRIKIVMLGEAGAGKTCLTHALVNCEARETDSNDSTIGVEMHHSSFGKDGLEACIVDCAGQRRYQLTHPFFLSEEALHIIVVNLISYQKTQESFVKYVEDWVNWITARLWKPRIMIVGTHRDELTDATIIQKCEDILKRIQEHEKREIKRLDREIKAVSKKISPQGDRDGAHVKEENLRWLRNNRPFISSKVLLGDNSEEGMKTKPEKETCLNLVAVASTQELKGMRLLQEEICRVARCKTSTTCAGEGALFPLVGIDLPTSWLNLEVAIREYRDKLKPSEVPCMTEEEFRKFAYEKAGLVGSEVVSGLHYLDSVGEIKFYKNLPKTEYSIFLDLPWLCKLAKLLFRHDYDQGDAIEFKEEYCEFGMESIMFENHLTQLKDNGRLSVPLLRCIWMELQLNDVEFFNMIKCLVTFGLACEIPPLKEEMFIPWFLHSELDAKAKKEKFPDIPPSDCVEVRLKFGIIGYLPAGLFDRLCVRCYALGIDVMTWKNSMLIYKGDIQIYLEVIESVITVIGRTKSKTNVFLWIAMLEIIKELRHLLSEWPRIVYNTYTICPQCILKKAAKPHHFDCKWWKGQTPTSLRCKKSSKHSVNVTQLVPPAELLHRPDQPLVSVVVSDVLMRDLSKKIPKHWETIGTFLGLPNEKINAIKVDYAGNVNEQAYSALSSWKQVKGKEATKLAFIEALKKSEREDLVSFVCDSA